MQSSNAHTMINEINTQSDMITINLVLGEQNIYAETTLKNSEKIR